MAIRNKTKKKFTPIRGRSYRIQTIECRFYLKLSAQFQVERSSTWMLVVYPHLLRVTVYNTGISSGRFSVISVVPNEQSVNQELLTKQIEPRRNITNVHKY